MSQSTEQPSHPTTYKKRRLQGACDICRQKKIRCDASIMPDNCCSNCIAFGSECTQSGVRKRTAPSDELIDSHFPSMNNKSPSESHPKGPVHLPPRLGKFQEESQTVIHPLVQSMLPSSLPIDFDTQVSLMALSKHILNLEQEVLNLKQTSSRELIDSEFLRHSTFSEIPQGLKYDDPGSSLSISDEVDVSAHMKRLTISTSHTRHFGPSSTLSLLGTAVQIGKETQNHKKILDDNFSFRRPQFWNVHSWEYLSEEVTAHEFPDRELLNELVDLFFDNVNALLPLLHRPTFEKAVKEGLYLSNRHFGATVLGVCAVASRYSDNPRVLLEGIDSLHCSGWKWFRQIRHSWRFPSTAPSLYALQTILLSLLYMQASSQPEACWVMAGIGIRYAQDSGAHRRKPNQKPSVENELWKRCFWLLVCVDAFLCSFLGRPRATVSGDFDLDLPLDCDDEYWEADSASSFLQPPGKPSKVSGFITYLRLMELLEFAQCTLYAVNQSKRFRGPARGQTDEEVVAYLDSELNQWFDHIPDHLKWTPCSPGGVFYNQSAMLHACYHHVRILVHRPFIPLPKKPSPLPYPSLAICANAARACAHILMAQSQQGTYLPFCQTQFALFTSAIVLLLNHWTNLKGNKGSKPLQNPSEDVKTVQDCVSVLSKLEGRWVTSGRLCDVIRELSSYGDVPITALSDQTSRKRKSDDPYFDTPTLANHQPQFPQSPPYQVPGRDNVPQAYGNAAWSFDVAPSHVVGNDGDWSGSSDEHTANPVQFTSELGLHSHEDSFVPYTMQTHNITQWPIMMPTGETSMDDGDVAMLWLQQPQISEWMDLGRCTEWIDELSHPITEEDLT